jgi:transcriptional regulator with XRE-family HTH domain
MKARGWGLVETAVRVGVSNKTLAKILDGKLPKRLDALYRVLDGLKIPIEEALIDASSHQTKERPRLYVLPGGREPDRVA